MATEVKGRLRRCISNTREHDGWRRLQWKQHVFTSQRISNRFFSSGTTNLFCCWFSLSLRLGGGTLDGGNKKKQTVLKEEDFTLPGLTCTAELSLDKLLVLSWTCLRFGFCSHLLQSQLKPFMFSFLKPAFPARPRLS